MPHTRSSKEARGPSSSKKRRFSINSEMEQLPPSKRQLADQRVAAVADVMRDRHGMQVHDSSYLTYIFATNTADDDCGTDEFSKMVATVADEAAAAQRIYGKTHMAHVNEDALRGVANYLHEEFPNVPWKVLWKRVKMYVNPILKTRAIRMSEANECDECDITLMGGLECLSCSESSRE